MRVLRRLLLFLLLLVVVAGGWLATRDLDLSGWRPEVEAAVRNLTGRGLGVDGEFEVQLLPAPRITATGLSFSNADWGARPAMLTAKRVTLGLELVPLFFGDVNVRAIALEGVDLLAETNARGESNWEFSGGAKADGASQALLAKLAALDASAVRIDWREAGKPAREIKLDSARLTDNRVGGFDIVLKGAFDGETREITGRLSSLSAYLAGKGLRGRVVTKTPTLEASFDGDLGQFPTTDGMDLEIKASGQRWPLFSDLTGLPTGSTPPWDMTFHVRGRLGSLDVSEFDMTSEHARISGKFTLNRQHEEARVEGLALDVTASGDRWPYLATLVGFPEGDLPHWNVKGTVTGDEDTLEVSGIDALLDKSDLAGALTVTLGAEPTKVAGTLTSRLLDVSTPERWWQGTLNHPSTQGSGTRLFSDAPVETGWMEAVDLDLKISAETLTTKDLTGQKADSTIGLTGKVLSVKLEADVFGGHGSVSFTADASHSPMTYRHQTEIVQADMQGVTQEWFGLPLVDAKGSLRYEIDGAGQTLAQIMGGMSGSGTLVLGEGTVRAGVAERAVRGIATMAMSTLLHAEKVDDVKMNCMVSEVQITDGIAEFEVLVLDTERATIVGSGHVNLAEETWDVYFKPKPKVFALNAAVPIHMTGPFHDPEIKAQKIGVLRKIAGAVSLFVFPPAAVAGLADFGAGNHCVEMVQAGKID